MSFETRVISFRKQDVFRGTTYFLRETQDVFRDTTYLPRERQDVFRDTTYFLRETQAVFRDTTYFLREKQDVFRDTATLVDSVKCCHADSMKTVPSYQYMITNCDVINSNECVKAWKN